GGGDASCGGHRGARGRCRACARRRVRERRRRGCAVAVARRAQVLPALPRRGERDRGRSGGGIMTLLEIFDPKAPPRPIGIDLGTTNSLVAYVRSEKPVAIADCDQEILLPSVVAYHAAGDVVVGRRAKDEASERPRD